MMKQNKEKLYNFLPLGEHDSCNLIKLTLNVFRVVTAGAPSYTPTCYMYMCFLFKL